MRRLLLFISLLILSTTSATLAAKPKKDKEGSKDHPLIQRYKNSYIVGYNYTDFDKYDLVTGPKKKRENTPTRSLEGEVTTIIYETADNSESLLKVFRNFEIAFKKAGVKKLYTCDNKACGKKMTKEIFGNKRVRGRYRGSDPWNMGGSINYYFWNGVLNKAGKEVYVTLIVNSKNFGKYPTNIVLDVVEVAEMESDLVVLDPDFIKNELAISGRVVLSGVEFDTDKDTLKESSFKALETIATYLKGNPKSNVYIVGHTDNQGKYGYNKNLSERRAYSIVRLLTSKYKINKDRLTAIGVADVSPIANNSNSDSSAKNRRVEMVLR